MPRRGATTDADERRGRQRRVQTQARVPTPAAADVDAKEPTTAVLGSLRGWGSSSAKEDTTGGDAVGVVAMTILVCCFDILFLF